MSLDNADADQSTLLRLLQFTWLDYTLFIFMIVVSAAIGVYFGFFGKKQDNAEEYLFGGRTMKIFPIAMSLVASHLSGITLLGVPSEIYLHGTQYAACLLSAVYCSVIIIYVYLPVFYELGISSSYEYLKRRFDGKIRSIASFLYALSTILHVPIVIYIPALAFNQVSGMNIYHIAPAVCLVCIFYTTIGGLKAVVWTDTLQFMVTLGSMVTVFWMGVVKAGGFSNIVKVASEGDRIEFFNLNLDPTTRTTFWGVVIGMGTMWVANLGVNPSSVQRFLSVPSITAAKRSVIIFGSGMIFTKALSCFAGLIIYAKYVGCDPKSIGAIKRNDQILPYYVLDVASNIIGLPGLFISGVFSTALSTMSANLNTLSGTIYEDFILPHFQWAKSDKAASNIMKGLVVINGAICVIFIFMVEKLGSVLQISLSFTGMTAGPILGLFTLGMLFRKANAKGALYGSIASLLIMSWILIGNQLNQINKNIVYPTKAVSVAECEYPFNAAFVNKTTSSNLEHDEPLWMYRISFYWYTLMGASLVVLVGLPVSLFTRNENDDIEDERFITPWLRRKSKLLEQANKAYVPVFQSENGCKNLEMKVVYSAADEK